MAKPLDVPGAETVVGASVTVRGELNSPGDVLIDGDVTAEGDVTVGRTGLIEGNLTGRNVRVSGRVHGEIGARDHFELRYSGHLEGDVSCQSIEIHTGGYLASRVVMKREGAEELREKAPGETPEQEEDVAEGSDTE